MKSGKNKSVLSALAVLVALFAGACSGGGMAGQPGPGEALIDMPAPSPELFAQLQAHTYLGSWSVADNGLAKIRFADTDIHFAVITKTGGERPLLYSYSFPDSIQSTLLEEFIDRGQGVRASARSSALAMIMINPLLLQTRLGDKQLVAEEVITDPRFEQLVRRIEDYKLTDPFIVLDYKSVPDLYYMSGEILVASMKRIADRLPDRQSTYQPASGISIDTDMAYPETFVDDKGEDRLRFANPKMNYYVAGTRQKDVVDADIKDWSTYGLVVIPGKERWLDISIFPPKFEVVPPALVNAGMLASAQYINIYKGFQFDMSIQELLAIPPAKMALIANSWQSMIMMLALAGDVSVFFTSTNVLNWLSDELVTNFSFDDLMNSVQTRDKEATINSVYDVFKALLPRLEEYFKQEYADSDNILGSIVNVFNGVNSLVSGGSIVNSILDISTREIPFYVDLFTSHSSAMYPYFEGKVQAFPNSPLISKLVPEVPINGHPVYIRGYGLGANAESGQLLMNGNPVSSDAIHKWEDGLITMIIPLDEEGDVTDGRRSLTLQVISPEGTSNSYNTTYDFREEYLSGDFSGDAAGGGGGCSVVAGTPAETGAVTFILVTGLVIGWRRRSRLAA